MSSEEFIDMELSLSPSSSSSSLAKYRDFEFPLSASSSYSADYFNSQLDHQNSADELFYQGKLLPLLHLPPKLHLNVQKLLSTHQNFIIPINNNEHTVQKPSIAPTTNPSTPPKSCRVSCDLDDDCFFEWSKDARGFTHHRQTPQLTKKRLNNWTQRLYHKLKASRDYLRSLFFTKSATCSRMDSSNHGRRLSMAVRKSFPLSSEKKDAEGCNKKKTPLMDFLFDSHRKSFSGAIQHQYSIPTSLSSYSSSSSSTPSLFFNSSGGSSDFQLLKRSRSADSEMESSVEDAIAHCKQSQSITAVELEAACK